MANSTKFYRRWYAVAYVLFHTFFRLKIIGRDNIEQGPAMVCVNHSSVIDPIFIGITLGKYDQPLYIAKKEIFSVPFLSWLVKGLGAESVDRTKADIGIVKIALNSLKKGKKVIIFPEGTRVAEENTQTAKLGAVKIAEKTEVPILPVYLSTKKHMLRAVKNRWTVYR